MAVASLVLGIISIVLSFIPGFAEVIGLILGIVGIVLSSTAKKNGAGSLATAGLVLSIIGLVLCAVLFVACGWCAACACV